MKRILFYALLIGLVLWLLHFAFTSHAQSIFDGSALSGATGLGLDTMAGGETDIEAQIMPSLSPAAKLDELPFDQRADFKSAQIAKVGNIARSTVDGLDIQVQPPQTIPRGVELFLKAWNSQGEKIAFDDGTVEIEHVRIINPPVYVPAGTFHTEQQYSPVSGKFEDTDVPDYTYDPAEALRQVLASLVRSVGVSNSKIIDGKVGMTTTVIYPDAGNPGTSSVDGTLTCNASTWANAYAGTSCAGGVDVGAATTYMTVAQYDNVGAGNVNADRTVLNFVIPSLSGDTITSATVSFMLHSASNRDDDSSSLAVYSNLIASNTTLASTDFPPANYGSTQYSTGKTLASIIAAGTEVYTDLALNSTGLAALSASSTAHLAIRDTGEVANSSPSGRNYLNQVYQADAAGTTNDPKLTIVSSPATPDLGSGSSSTLPTVDFGGSYPDLTYPLLLAVLLIFFVLIF